MYSYGPPHMAVQKQDDQHEHTFSNYVRIRDAVQKTCLRRWTIGKSGERGSGISVLPARHDDDEDDFWNSGSHLVFSRSPTESSTEEDCAKQLSKYCDFNIIDTKNILNFLKKNIWNFILLRMRHAVTSCLK